MAYKKERPTTLVEFTGLQIINNKRNSIFIEYGTEKMITWLELSEEEMNYTRNECVKNMKKAFSPVLAIFSIFIFLFGIVLFSIPSDPVWLAPVLGISFITFAVLVLSIPLYLIPKRIRQYKNSPISVCEIYCVKKVVRKGYRNSEMFHLIFSPVGTSEQYSIQVSDIVYYSTKKNHIYWGVHRESNHNPAYILDAFVKRPDDYQTSAKSASHNKIGF